MGADPTALAVTAERPANPTADPPIEAGGVELRVRFERLFREFAPYVLRVLPRMGVAERDGDDVVQEVFLAVFRGLPGFEGRSSERTWIYGICIRTCSNYRQRAHRWRERLPGELPEGVHAHTPEQALQTSSALQRLDRALAQLPPVQREVFVLFEIEQLTVSEIAQALQCSKFTVYSRLYRGRAAVEAHMHTSEKEGADA